MPFSFVYVFLGEYFFVHINDDGFYCAKVFGKWIYGDSVERVTHEIERYVFYVVDSQEQ